MSGDQKNSKKSVEKLTEASSTSLFPTSLSSPGTPPPPPPPPLPPPLPSPRVRDIPASLSVAPAVPPHKLYKLYSNLPPLVRCRAEACNGLRNQYGKKQRKPQLEPKPASKTVKRPPPPPPLPQLPTLIPKPSPPTPPRLTPKPVTDKHLSSAGNKQLSTGESSSYALKDKRMKKSEDNAKDNNSDDNGEKNGMQNQLAVSGASDTKTGQEDNGKELTPERRLLRARHGGGGFKPQGECSQPSIYTYRPVPISSEAPVTAVRPSFQPITKSCTATAPSSSSTFVVPTGESSLLSTNNQDSFKLVASSSAVGGQQMDQCVPTGAPVHQKKKLSALASSAIASILMPPPPSPVLPGQKNPTKGANKMTVRPGFLTLQEQIRVACAILKRAEQIRAMTDLDRRTLVANVLHAICGPQASGQLLQLGRSTVLILRTLQLREIGQQAKEQDTTLEKSDDQPE